MDLLVTLYHSYNDPISKGLIVEYLKEYQIHHSKRVKVYLITFEQNQYRLSASQKKETIKQLKKSDIFWHPLKYHTGGVFLVFKKIFDFLLLLSLCTAIITKHRIKYVIGFTSASGTMAVLISLLFRKKAIVMNMEPHSLYMVEFGIWNEKSLKYRLTAWLEDMVLKSNADIAIPTHNYLNDLEKNNFRVKKYSFLATSIKTDDFKWNENCRKLFRNKFSIDEKKIVFIYVGKFGGIYYSAKEMAFIYASILGLLRGSLFFVITGNDRQEIEKAFLEVLPIHSFIICEPVRLEELGGYLSMGDFGVMFLPPLNSQRYRCPIKTANYWANGLPVIINKGVGDDDVVAKKEQVGIVIEDVNEIGDNKKFCKEVISYMSMDKDYLRGKCRKTAYAYRGIHNTINYLDQLLK